MKKNKKLILAALILAIAAAVLVGVYWFARPDTQLGAKAITVDVVHKDGTIKTFAYQTDAEYLDDVLVPDGLIAGEDGPYGLYVLVVDGETADYTVDSGWWCLYKNDEMTVTGVSEVTVADGDHFQWVYTIG